MMRSAAQPYSDLPFLRNAFHAACCSLSASKICMPHVHCLAPVNWLRGSTVHELPKHCNRALTPPVMRGQIATAVAMIPNVANALGNCCPLPDAHLRLRDSAHAFTEFLIYPLAALWLKHNILTAVTTQLYALTDAWCITPSDCLSSPSSNRLQICMVSLDGIPRTCAHAY